MKKLLLVTLAGGFILSACGNDTTQESNADETGETVEAEEVDTEEANDEAEDEINEETDEKTESDDPLLSVDLTDQTLSQEEWDAAFDAQEALIEYDIEEISYAWKDKDESGGISHYSYYALVTNTGKGAIMLNPSSVTYYNEDGSVASVSEMGVNIYPEIINEGEQAVVTAYEFAEESELGEFDYAEMDYNPFLSVFESTELKLENAEYENGFNLTAKAVLKNETESDATDVSSAFAFFDDQENFIGALTFGMDDPFAAGNQRGIETENPPFPLEAEDKINQMSSWSYFTDYSEFE